LQLGFSFQDLFFLDVGFLTDILTEKNNDSYDWPIEGSAEDLKKMMGG